MKKSAAPALILIFLVLAVGIFVVFRISRSDAPDTQTPDAAATATPEPTATAEPTAAPTATAAPAATAAPTTAPTSTPVPTAAPTATPVPTVAPTAAPTYGQTGSFRSDSGTYLNIVVKWTTVDNGGTPSLKLDVYAESYALSTGDRISDVVFNVGGATYYASSKAIHTDSAVLTESYLGSATADVTAGADVAVSVTWYFNGSYSNKEISTIVAEDTIHIG